MELYAYLEVKRPEDNTWVMCHLNKSDGFLEEAQLLAKIETMRRKFRVVLPWNQVICKKICAMTINPLFPGLIYRDVITPVSNIRGLPPDASPFARLICSKANPRVLGWLYLDEIMMCDTEETVPVCGWLSPDNYLLLPTQAHPNSWEVLPGWDLSRRMSAAEWSSLGCPPDAKILATWNQPVKDQTSDFFTRIQELDEKAKDFIDSDESKRSRLIFYLDRATL